MEVTEINQKLKTRKYEALEHELRETEAKADPFEQFIIWFNQALEVARFDPSAMILATVDKSGWPDTRVVLLKELEDRKFIFYTGYDSKKAKDLIHQQVAALNFYWPDLYCQIRIRGRVEKVSREKSEHYFSTRPREAQIGTHAWVQSSVLNNREEIDDRVRKQTEKLANQEIPCPENWGGYALTPFEYEFFQRRQWRMHDRLFYSLTNNTWKMQRLAP